MIHVSFQIHDEHGTYCKYLGTALYSLFENTRDTIVVHLLCDSTLKEQDKVRLRQLAKKYDNLINFYEVKIDDEIFKLDKQRKWYYSVGTFFRLYLIEFLPESVKKIITLDPDMIFNIDIKTFWDIEFAGKEMVAVKDTHIKYMTHPLIEKGILKKNAYFNAGIMMLNVADIRDSMDMAKNGVKILRQYYDDIVCADQDIFNFLFLDKCRLVDEKYNLSVNMLRRQGIKMIYSGIYHYINRAYMSGKFDIYDRLFLKYFCETSWADLNFYYKAFIFLLEKHNELRVAYFKEKTEILKNKKIIYFGAKSYLNKLVMNYLPPSDDSFFLDNSSELWGETVWGLSVKNPIFLKKYNQLDDCFVMVTSSKYSEIKEQLQKYGLNEDMDFMWAENFLAGVEPYEKEGMMTLIDQSESKDIL